ncbi:hypothetical protein [Sphingomonas sp.]|uniref:hypothetical protein n=1 Tax=Sphingomonas sp. TaxID=28214 RepID=UPI003CC648BE
MPLPSIPLTLAAARLDCPALHYRSATRCGDGDPLPVIDSRMPVPQHRLGLWRPGALLPLLAGRCVHPRLAREALWCGDPQ